ncbi:MAG: hypothetical protein A2X82_08915 [Geobacteraceae bacterium GWC2_55_20]|nr:MAG: hypothetical protein A2X82_08915 [Geobacteraceae bacterium GWC2_55_20]OGU19285.1 MAG: hypothetical protein A2X85_09040 [Geobacteraceae bacterium GWF2_54_21]HCE67666.1 hypothetical protein [Geobacter sp.]
MKAGTVGHLYSLDSEPDRFYSSGMPSIRIPSGTIVKPRQSYSREDLADTLAELCQPGSDFTGFISFESNNNLHLLFFFKGAPYSAGKSIGEKPFSLSIREFFREISLPENSVASVSVHATDPVLLKCLLIFIQDNLTVKAPVALINLEAVLDRIRQESADALIILEKQGLFNFFFFKDGNRGKSYYSDPDVAANDSVAMDEQVLEYAFREGDVDALVYRNMATMGAADSDSIDLAQMLSLLVSRKQGTTLAADSAADRKIRLSVTGGPLAGKSFEARIPCVLGRKDSDIIVADPMVSKTHAAIRLMEGRLTLVDLNSTNGTTLNEQPVKQQELKNGDVIGMGSTFLKFLGVTPE